MWGRGAFALPLLAVVVLVAGCGSSSSGGSATPGSAPASSARAAQADPCTLLNAAQLRLLRFSKGAKQQASDELGGTTCVWSGYPIEQGPKYTARLLSGDVPGGTPSASIDNLPTTQYVPPGVDPARNCGFLISVGSGKTLVVQFSASGSARMSHPVACQKAQAAASNMASTYNSRPPT